eukprot:GDKH01025166.1.p1 GENE.GDKH01025166.1~~GDKH01025166.1.p1  ORF type:complete len:145 (-),score=10.39 GDKH01025166.1:94-528(-)
MSIACVAYVGRENQPLCVRCFTDVDELSLHFAVYSALDVVEEKDVFVKHQDNVLEPYLGFLGQAPCMDGDFFVYGFHSCTGLKILVVVSDGGFDISENLMRQLFQNLHRAYVETISDPFFADVLETEKFTAKLNKTVESFSANA